MSLLAGQSVGLVHEIKPAATIIREMVAGAHQIIEQRLNSRDIPVRFSVMPWHRGGGVKPLPT
jgi:hypothetical protein